MRDPCLARIRFRRDVGEEGCRLRFHCRKVASHIAAGPKAIIRRQSLEGVVARRGLARSCKSLCRLRRAKAARCDERGAVGGLQLRHSLPPCGFDLDLVRRRKRREQRLRLCDLGHFRGRRKAFERRREDDVGIERAAGRLVELRKRERRAQFKTPRCLPLRDGDSGLESFLGRRRVRRDRA